MSGLGHRREVLELGAFGRVPVDTLFELYLETRQGDLLTVYQTRCSASIGGWVYEAAACLAKYLESDAFADQFLQKNKFPADDLGSGSHTANSSPELHRCTRSLPLRGRRLVELGAGTGVVGIMAGYLGARALVTDLAALVPLINYNIEKNRTLMAGQVRAMEFCWGSQPEEENLLRPDFLVLANCIYYESSLELLLETVLTLTDQGSSSTIILACYEERTKEICGLVGRWHDLLQPYFSMYDVPSSQLDQKYCREYVRLVWIIPRNTSHLTV